MSSSWFMVQPPQTKDTPLYDIRVSPNYGPSETNGLPVPIPCKEEGLLPLLSAALSSCESLAAMVRANPAA